MSKLDCDSFDKNIIAIDIQNIGDIIPGHRINNRMHVHKIDKYDDKFIDRLIKLFNTWYFKREHPDSVHKLHAVIKKAVKDRKPISFVLYWGKGPRSEQAHPDVQCLNYLNELTQRIQSIYHLGVTITLIFTDTHARLNGFSTRETQSYFSEIVLSAKRLKFNHCFLGNLVENTDMSHEIAIFPSEKMLSTLTVSAAKWYRGSDAPHIAAATYYSMNMIEKKAVESAFPESIFITFNGSEMRELFPDNMSIFYMYSIKRGTSVKPWFIPAPPHDDANDAASI